MSDPAKRDSEQMAPYLFFFVFFNVVVSFISQLYSSILFRRLFFFFKCYSLVEDLEVHMTSTGGSMRAMYRITDCTIMVGAFQPPYDAH